MEEKVEAHLVEVLAEVASSATGFESGLGWIDRILGLLTDH